MPLDSRRAQLALAVLIAAVGATLLTGCMITAAIVLAAAGHLPLALIGASLVSAATSAVLWAVRMSAEQ